MAALREEMLRVGFLKVSAADFVTRNLSCNGKDGNTAAMTVIESVDQMKVSRTAAPRADGQLARQVGLGAGRECSRLFVAQMNPFELPSSANRIRDSVQRITTDTVHPPHSSLG